MAPIPPVCYTMGMRVKALYGNVAIDRQKCPACGDWAFVIKGRMACCDLVVDAQEVKRLQRMSQPERRRRQPSSDEKIAILSDQNHRCFWCDAPFDGAALQVRRRSQRMVKLSPYWDHVEPFEWSHNNNPLNFVASCSVCNGIKSSKMFTTIEETRDFILKRREKKGWVNCG